MVGHFEHGLGDQRRCADTLDAGNTAGAFGGPVQAARIELNHPFGVGQPTVANAGVLRIELALVDTANHRVKDVRDELKEGQQILVKVINIDPTGKIRLSRKALLQEEAQKAASAPAAKE